MPEDQKQNPASDAPESSQAQAQDDAAQQPQEPSKSDQKENKQQQPKDGKSASELEKEIKKLQGQVAVLQELVQQKNAEIERLKQALASGAEAQKQLAAARAQIEELKAQLKAKEVGAKRAKLIATKYPELAPFEEKGLLPDTDNPDELDKILSEFAELVRGQAPRNQGEEAGGQEEEVFPGTPGTEAGKSASKENLARLSDADLTELAMQALASDDFELYEKAMNILLSRGEKAGAK